MNADKRIRYLESQIKRQRQEILLLRRELAAQARRLLGFRGSASLLTTQELAGITPRQPSLDELVLGYGE